MAQNQNDIESEETTEVVQDTLIYKQKYGLRVGIDLSKIVRSFLDDNYTGLELIGDYRITDRLYLAGEIGNETRTLQTDFLDNTTKGTYFKAGVDMNFYQNWLDMQNMIFGGFRIGASSFNQTLNSFTIYDVNNTYFGQYSDDTIQSFEGLTALWAEIIIGIKAELFNNFFAGINTQIKFLLADKAPDNFENLYIPGFNRTYDSSAFGAGYSFTLSYMVPIFKKDKIVIQERETE